MKNNQDTEDSVSSQFTVEEHLQILLNESDQHLVLNISNEVFPPWYDEVKFKRGQSFYQANMFAMFATMLAGLISVLAVPSILKILIFTDRSSTAATAYKRYVETILHIDLWYSKDFSPKSELWSSLIQVRSKHTIASQRSYKADKQFITQRDMALTQFGFIGYALVRSKMFGINLDNKEDAEGLIHFWRVIGWLLGIDDRYNICRESISETYDLINGLLTQYFAPAIRKNDERFQHMYTVLLEGMWCVMPLVFVNSFMMFTFRVSSDRYIVSPPVWKEEKTTYPFLQNQQIETPRLNTNYWLSIVHSIMIYIFEVLLQYFIFRAYFNSQMRMSVFLLKYFPFLAYWKYGIENSKINLNLQSKN